ncbi:hypothetical protein BD769DRAFT_1380665 [Suillus cothurnatus]|nr:hypothetical protein BD769DRAFT_1380665 [Suillus cothurnatus]
MQTNNPSVALNTDFLSPPILATVSPALSLQSTEFFHTSLKASAYHPSSCIQSRSTQGKVYCPFLPHPVSASTYHPSSHIQFHMPTQGKRASTLPPAFLALLKAKEYRNRFLVPCYSHPENLAVFASLVQSQGATAGLEIGQDFGDTSPMDDEDPLQLTAEFVGTGDRLYRNYHPFLSAHPCDPDGAFLPPGAPPPPITEKSLDDWTPYGSRVEFELANYLFTKNQTPTHSINQLLNIWVASLVQAGSKCTVFSDHRDLYKKIDNTPLGDVKWQSFSVEYTGAIPDKGALTWMEDSHDVWFRDPCEVVQNMLANPDFAMEMNLQPYCEFVTENHEHQWKDFMSGDWSWAYADKISEDPDTHSSTFVPVILGSDKTTVSVTTGQNDYYPLYASIGNVQNNAFLQCPKTTKSKCCSPVYYEIGVPIRCLSCRGNLDEINLCRSRSHTDALIKECDSGTLKSEYGLVGKLVVPHSLHFIYT